MTRYIIVNKFNGKWVLDWEVDFRGKPYSVYESNRQDPLHFHSKEDAEETAKRLDDEIYVVVEVSK